MSDIAPWDQEETYCDVLLKLKLEQITLKDTEEYLYCQRLINRIGQLQINIEDRQRFTLMGYMVGSIA